MCYICDPEKFFIMNIISLVKENSPEHISKEADNLCKSIRNNPIRFERKLFNAFLNEHLNKFQDGQKRSHKPNDLFSFENISQIEHTPKASQEFLADFNNVDDFIRSYDAKTTCLLLVKELCVNDNSPEEIIKTARELHKWLFNS